MFSAECGRASLTSRLPSGHEDPSSAVISWVTIRLPFRLSSYGFYRSFTWLAMITDFTKMRPYPEYGPQIGVSSFLDLATLCSPPSAINNETDLLIKITECVNVRGTNMNIHHSNVC